MSHNQKATMTEDHFRTIPEAFETNRTECLTARAKALAKVTGLGPPDLCNVIKIQEKQTGLLGKGAPQASLVGSYHQVLGVDCSSPAAIAAYFNSLLNDLGNPKMTKGAWRIQSGTYCSYNAFANVDVRVEVTMPGTVNAYVLDSQGRRFGCDDQIWEEVHVCATLRALARPDPFKIHIDCLRYMYPFSHPTDEVPFLRAAENLFWDGIELGTTEMAAPPNNVNNRLAMGVRDYFFKSSRFAQGMDFFARFVEKDPEVATVLAAALDQFHQTSSAVCLLARHLLSSPPSAALLLSQSQLLATMGQKEMALKMAKLAVDLAPAQASSWISLAHMYTTHQDYAAALVALNAAPMAHGTDSPMPEFPPPARLSNNSEVLRVMVEEEEDGDQSLPCLPANLLRGTFVSAYGVLTRILSDITWDELLAYRSAVFLMEDEFDLTFTPANEPVNHPAINSKTPANPAAANDSAELDQSVANDNTVEDQSTQPLTEKESFHGISGDIAAEPHAAQDLAQAQQATSPLTSRNLPSPTPSPKNINEVKSDEAEADMGTASGQADMGTASGQADMGTASGQADIGTASGQADMGTASGQNMTLRARDENSALVDHIARESEDGEAMGMDRSTGERTESQSHPDTEADNGAGANSMLSQHASHPAPADTNKGHVNGRASSKVLQTEGGYDASCPSSTGQPSLQATKDEQLSSISPHASGGATENQAANPKVPTAKGGKRLLERWLDQLFTALYQDIMCSVIWNAQELHVQQSHGLPSHTVGDYLRFGILSKRLGKKDDACKAFKMCTSQGFCLRGMLNILDIYSRDGLVEESLAACAAIGQFYDMHTDLAMPVEVEHAVCRLIAKHGLAMLCQLGGQWVNSNETVKKIIAKAVAWHVKGYDK